MGRTRAHDYCDRGLSCVIETTGMCNVPDNARACPSGWVGKPRTINVLS